jgi:hypothetical protein
MSRDPHYIRRTAGSAQRLSRDRQHKAAKLAVRAYVRNPSSKNEAGVEEALRRVRRFDSVARWRGSKTVLQATHPHACGTWRIKGSPEIRTMMCHSKSLKHKKENV